MQKYLLFLIAAISLVAPTHAVTGREREVLQRLDTELKALSPLVEESAQAANPNDRHQVNYQQLREDFARIQQGISDIVHSQKREPRSLPPIEGDYR